MQPGTPEIRCMEILENAEPEFPAENTSFSRYLCNMCGKSFVEKSNLSDHMIEHMYGLPICHICGKGIPKQEYKSHIICHVKNKEQYICGTCNEYFATKGSLKLHFLRKHTYKRKLGYKCHDCTKVFHNKSILEMHIKQGHLEMKTFICDLCQKNFKSYVGLKAHIKIHDDDDDDDSTSLHQCNYCEKLYADKSKLSIHLRIHTGEKPHKCDLCGRSFRLKAALSLHLKSHNKFRPFECEVCKKNFLRKDHLKSHLAIHHSQSYSCQQCERKYRHRDTLVNHIQKYHSPVNCANCGENLENLVKLEAHMKTHKKKLPKKKEISLNQVDSDTSSRSYQITKTCRVSLTRFDVV